MKGAGAADLQRTAPWAISLRADLRRLDHALPLRHLGRDHAREFLWRARRGDAAVAPELLLNLGIGQHLTDRLVELADDRRGRAGGGEDAEPHVDLEAG